MRASTNNDVHSDEQKSANANATFTAIPPATHPDEYPYLKTKTEDVICYCPICQNQVLFEDSKLVDADYLTQPVIAEKLYCPHCEILVEPVVARVVLLHAHPEFRSDTPGDHGQANSSARDAVPFR
jgi:hypothetical protein